MKGIYYSEPTAPTLEMNRLQGYLQGHFPTLPLEVRESFVPFHLGRLDHAGRESALASLAAGFARAKVRNPVKLQQEFDPLPGEIEYEKKRLASPQQPFGLLYDGFLVMDLLRELIPREETSLSHLHIVFTNQLLGTWEEGRYHARVIILGYPCLISTTGLVEAPARPREYYILKQRYQALGLTDAAVASLDEQFRSRFIAHNDPRLTEAMKGYVMQAVFFHLTGEPFCQDRHCRLYNAHWQEEVIAAQLENPQEYCPLHQRELARLRQEMV